MVRKGEGVSLERALIKDECEISYSLEVALRELIKDGLCRMLQGWMGLGGEAGLVLSMCYLIFCIVSLKKRD